jgi:hypothetical protein
METSAKSSTGLELGTAALIIGSHDLITEPGVKLIEVQNTPNIITDETEGSRNYGKEVYLVNFSATVPDLKAKAIESFTKALDAMDDGNQEEAELHAQDAASARLVFSIPVDEATFVPTKGQPVEAYVKLVKNREGKLVLRVRSIKPVIAEGIATKSGISTSMEARLAKLGIVTRRNVAAPTPETGADAKTSTDDPHEEM